VAKKQPPSTGTSTKRTRGEALIIAIWEIAKMSCEA
jgi:hypothetical protein